MIATVIGMNDTIAVTPTLDTNAYATGDRLGSIHTLTNAFRLVYRSHDGSSANISAGTPIARNGRIILAEITVIDQAKQSAAMDILFFSASPTVASADNAAIDITDAEMIAKCLGGVSIGTSYIALANNSITTERNINLHLKQDATSTVQDLYALPIVRGAATYAASSLKFLYKFYQD